MSTVHVTSDFRVVARHDSTPIPGIPIEIYDDRELSRSEAGAEWKPLLRLITSKEGTAEVKGLGKGRYVVQIGGPGGGSAVYAVVADQSGESRQEISLQWPYSLNELIKTSRLSGQLVSNNPWTPFENVDVELWAAGIEKPLAVESTGPQGRFQFDEARPGLYVLRIRGRQNGVGPRNQIEGDVSVEVVPLSPDVLPSVALRLAMSTCGIEFSRCPASNSVIATASRHVQVNYKPGMSEYPGIANAKFKLLDGNGALIAEGAADQKGIAQLPSEVAGKATLIVAGDSLMDTVQQSFDLLPADSSAADIVVTMTALVGSGSDCSVVSLENHATQK